jgi:hypothetical protein
VVPSAIHNRQIPLDYTTVRQTIFIASLLNVMWKDDLIDERNELFRQRLINCMKITSIVFGFFYLKSAFEITFSDEMPMHRWNGEGYKQQPHSSTFINIQLCQVLCVYSNAEITALDDLLFPVPLSYALCSSFGTYEVYLETAV